MINRRKKLQPYSITLTKRRKAHFISQKDLAICLGTSNKLISQWERSVRKPSWAYARKLRILLGGREYDYRECEEEAMLR